MKLSELLSQKIVLCGEGYLFALEKRGCITVGPFVPTCVIDNPESVTALHQGLVNCGSDIVEHLHIMRIEPRWMLLNVGI